MGCPGRPHSGGSCGKFRTVNQVRRWMEGGAEVRSGLAGGRSAGFLRGARAGGLADAPAHAVTGCPLRVALALPAALRPLSRQRPLLPWSGHHCGSRDGRRRTPQQAPLVKAGPAASACSLCLPGRPACPLTTLLAQPHRPNMQACNANGVGGVDAVVVVGQAWLAAWPPPQLQRQFSPGGIDPRSLLAKIVGLVHIRLKRAALLALA